MRHAVVIVAFAAACAEESASPFPTEAVHLVIDREGDVGPTGRLIGWNIGRGTLYARSGDAVHAEWRTPQRERAFALLGEIAAPFGEAPLVRFSGLQIDGALGNDGYHFWDFARPDREITPDDNMAPYQYMAIVDEIGAQPLVTLNFGSGTADEAARYVDHVVGTGSSPEATARRDAGRNEPWAVHAYEIGNEIYGFWNTGYSATGTYAYANPDADNGGDPQWHGRPASAASDYAARALTYADAVTAIDPDARFWIPLSQASMDAWGGLDAALRALEPLLVDPRIDAVVVHHYQVDDLAVHGWLAKAAPELALAGSVAFEPDYEDLRLRLDALPRSVPLQIAITEYHVAGAFTLGAFDGRADTHLVGLGVADVLLSFAHLGIDQAAQHMAVAFGGAATEEMLFESWYNPLRETASGEVLPAPSYVATALVAEHLRETTVRPVVEAMPTLVYDAESTPLEYPVVRAVAFADDASTTIVLLNRDLEREHMVTFDVAPQTWSVAGARAYAPATWDAPVGDAAIEVADLEVEQRGGRVRVELPRHSLVAISLSR